MELSFWQSKWRKNKIGFHMEQVYPPLKAHIQRFNLGREATILVPLSGKSLDVLWLAQQYRWCVWAVEVSEIAVNELKKQHEAAFFSSAKRSFTVHKSERLIIWQGDFNKLNADWLPPFELIYDKAALIALPPKQRKLYAEHVKTFLSETGQIYLQTFEYPQNEMQGPPFSVSQAEVEKLFEDFSDIHLFYKEPQQEMLKRFGKRGLKSYLTEKNYQIKH